MLKLLTMENNLVWPQPPSMQVSETINNSLQKSRVLTETATRDPLEQDLFSFLFSKNLSMSYDKEEKLHARCMEKGLSL